MAKENHEPQLNICGWTVFRGKGAFIAVRAGRRDPRKASGSFFTPSELAAFVAGRIVDSSSELFRTKESIRVLDPACGDGGLLVAFADAVPADVLKKVVLIGIDSNDNALLTAKEHLNQIHAKNVVLRSGDFIDLYRDLSEPTLFSRTDCLDVLGEKVDIVIANPPYVRTQILGAERAGELSRSFGLSGRVDLYHVFLIAMAGFLAQDGVLGVITSNKFLTTKGGASVREFLRSHLELLEVYDLGDTKLFDAAVLPAILVGRYKGRKSEQPRPARFTRIYEHLKDNLPERSYSSIFDAFRDRSSGVLLCDGQRFSVTLGDLAFPEDPTQPWALVTAQEAEWINRVQQNSVGLIEDFAKVRVGIKTTADDVFIRSDWGDLPSEVEPENALLRPLISHDNAGKWVSPMRGPKKKCVLYTHEIRDSRRRVISLEQYPHARAYLEMNRTRLESREYIAKAKRQWFEIWVPQDPAAWSLPKVVFPDISPEPRFSYDKDGYLVDGNCYWMTLNPGQDPDMLFLIQGIANSSLLVRYHESQFNNRLYAGRRRYLSQYVEKYPLPSIQSESSREIVRLVKQLVLLEKTVEEVTELERQIDCLVVKAFGVD